LTDLAGSPAGYEILEHTADVGIRAWGRTLDAAFEQAAWALVDILGATAGTPRRRVRLRAEGQDEGALLVDFLNELIALHETEEAAFASFSVRIVPPRSLVAEVGLAPVEAEPETTGVKAATYHQLRVDRRAEGGVEAVVYLDV
jgi:SHS2 domain-containing protein